LPFGGGSVWRRSLDGDPVAWAARDTGRFAPRPQGGDMRSHRIEERREDILAIWDARKDITLDELRDALAGIGLMVSRVSLHRFFVRHGITRRKRLATRSSKTAPTS
jgi:hypothetical protein